MSSKKKILVVSAVKPFPGASGQEQRVRNTLFALRRDFHLIFLTYAAKESAEHVKSRLVEFCDEAIVLPSVVLDTTATRILHKVLGIIFSMLTCLKESNYQIGQVELSSRRIASYVQKIKPDLALFEYWHAFKTAEFFRKKNIPCVLDMHDILWQSYGRHLENISWIPGFIKKIRISQYRKQEERAWEAFDAIISINEEEFKYVSKITDDKPLWNIPMGVDLARWPYCWNPSSAVRRIAYYGGLSNPDRQKDALLCYQYIMPIVWQVYPETEFWFIGGGPSAVIQDLQKDPRIKVTGFVDDVQKILSSVSIVLCPWEGTFGFRSRFVELMATGVPIVTSLAAIYGMQLEKENVFLAENLKGMADGCLFLLKDAAKIKKQSLSARKKVESIFGFENTYGRLSQYLMDYLSSDIEGTLKKA